nr:unnamed protein product [Callosobruchus chinensis]
MQAKDSRNYSILKLLLENGADPNIKLLHNEASLYYCRVIDDSRIVELLLQYGADPNMLDKNGKNPLFKAFLCDDDHTMEILLKYGANPNMLDKNGRVPLYQAINCDNDKREKYVELLLKYGADPNQKVNGSRVIECAPYFTNNGVMNLIKTLTLPYGNNDKVKRLMAEYGGVDRRYLLLGKDEKKAPSRPKSKGMDKNRKLFQSIIQEIVMVSMPAAYSYDLRKKVMEALDEGESGETVAKRFKIGETTLYEWKKRQRTER